MPLSVLAVTSLLIITTLLAVTQCSLATHLNGCADFSNCSDVCYPIQPPDTTYLAQGQAMVFEVVEVDTVGFIFFSAFKSGVSTLLNPDLCDPSYCEFDTDSPRLTVTSFDSSVAGSYRFNINGQCDFPFTISELIAPSITKEANPPFTLYSNSGPFTLSPIINHGQPPGSVYWYKDGVFLQTGDNYTSPNTMVQVEESGDYTASISNAIGNATTVEYEIIVKVAPDPVAVFQNDSSTHNSITLSWSYGFNGNAPITGVDITYTATSNYGNGLNMGDESGSISTDQLSLTIPNLQPLTTYQFSITVNNSVSDTVGSSSTIMVSADTLPIAPYAPTSVNVTAIDSTSVTVTWTANVDSFIQTPLMGFVFEYNILGNSTTQHIIISRNGVAMSHDITGLRKGTIYQVRVQSANSAGVSPFSDPGQGRTDIIFAPDPVAVFLNDSSTHNSITLSWSYGSFSGNAPITGVDITYTATSNYGNGLNKMGDESGSISTDQLSLTIPNLQPLTTYQFSITVNNSVSDTVGTSSAITVSADTLPIAPYAPTSVNVIPIDSTSLTVTWTASVDSFIQTPLMRFGLEYNVYGNSTVEQTLISNGVARSHVITGLRKGTTYQVRVQSANSAGASPFSDPEQGKTVSDASTFSMSTSTMTSVCPSSKPTTISELQNDSMPSYGVMVIVLLTISNILSTTVIIIIVVVWCYKGIKVSQNTTTTINTANVSPSTDDNEYEIKDAQFKS